MMSFTGPGTGRVLLLHLTKGDDLIKSIEQGIKEAGIQSGVVTSGIGALRKFRYHYITTTSDESTDVFETIEKPLELVCLQGIILEGRPHLHGMVSAYGSESYSGHVEEGCEIQYLAEISILEIMDMPLGRRIGQHSTISHFERLDG